MNRYYDKTLDHYLYCFVSSDLEIKIGYTWRIPGRKAALEKQKNTKLYLHGVKVINGTRSKVGRLERELHRNLNDMLGNSKISEWYPYSPVVLDYFYSATGAFQCFEM